MPRRKDDEAETSARGAARMADIGMIVDPDGMESSRTTHSSEKLKLCEQTILDHFGPVVAQVSAILLQRGRLALHELERFLCHSSTASIPLSRSQLLQTILSLVQHNLLYHIRLDRGGSIMRDPEEPGGTEYFEINPEAILVRNRFGTFMEIAEMQWGPEGLQIVQQILLNGKLHVAALLDSLPSTSSSTRPLLTHMLLNAYIVPSSPLAHISPHDLREAYMLQAKRDIQNIPSTKDLKAAEIRVSERIAQEREHNNVSGLRVRGAGDQRDMLAFPSGSTASAINGRDRRSPPASKSSSRGKKRKSLAIEQSEDESDDDRKKKRPKAQANGVASETIPVTNGASQRQPDWMKKLSDTEKRRLDELIVDNDCFVRVNYDRFDVHIRNELLHRMVASTFNLETADVYMRIIAEADAQKLHKGACPSVTDTRSDAVSVTMLAASFEASSKLSSGFDKKALSSLTSQDGMRLSRYDYVSEYIALLSRSEDVMAKTVAADASINKLDTAAATTGLRLLIAGNGFADVQTVTGSRISSSCVVDFAAAGRKLKWTLLKKTVGEVFGETASKCLGVLRREGKLEEKQIAKLALLSLKDTREICTNLFSSSIISLQEVPKSLDRNPQRTFFLYYIDYSKSLSWLSDHLFKTQARLCQRRSAEREKSKVLLAKIDRTDVREEGVERVLSRVELERLHICNKKLRELQIVEEKVQREAWVLARMRG